MGTVDRTSSPEEIRRWLCERVAFYLDKPVDRIDPRVELAEYGMDSVYSMSLIAEIEDNLGIKIDEMAAWKYTTIDAMIEYSSTLVAGHAG